MKMVSRTLFVCLLVLGLLAPTNVLADEYQTLAKSKVEKAILPGTSHVTYAGQAFVFDTSVPLQVMFSTLGPNLIQIKVKADPTGIDGSGRSKTVSGDDEFELVWVNWNKILYSGPPPVDPWGVILDTESGYTEK